MDSGVDLDRQRGGTGELGQRGVREPDHRGADRGGIRSVVGGDHGAECRRGRRCHRERIACRVVQHDARGHYPGQLRQLGGEPIPVAAIERVLLLERAIDRRGATDGHRDRDREAPEVAVHGATVACWSAPPPASRWTADLMNAVAHMISLLPPEVIRRIAALRPHRFVAKASEPRGVLDVEQASARVFARWDTDLCGLLNAMTRGELAVLAMRLGVRAELRSPVLRAALWERGAALERGDTEVSPAVQPRPIVLGGHLVVQARPRGLYPPSATWPRAMPAPLAAAPPGDEPDTLDELLAAADRAIGVRLGARGRDKGAWGLRAARLLGIVERNESEPDWRGDVEVKTVPVAREPSGWWRVVEDPAIAMMNEPVLAKLQRTLWLARSDVGSADATIVSWYLLDWDPDIARLARRYLHDRPKGPAGSFARGHYLHKRFFADAGMLATLNGTHPG